MTQSMLLEMDHAVDDDVVMNHFTAPPYEKGLCGTPLTGAFADDDVPVDCVVCAQMHDAMQA